MFKSLLVALFLSAASVSAQPLVEKDFSDWALKEDMVPATYAFLSKDGDVLESGGVGIAADTALPIASVSKSLSSQCVLYLIDTGQLALTATLSEILGCSGEPGSISIENLLTNASGFSAYPTLEGMGLIEHSKNHKKVAALVDAISRRELLGQTGTFRYNNENWLVLEQVVLTIVGREPVEWCFDNAPALQSLASLGRYDDLAAVGFAGGMSISAPDLARFFNELTYREDWPKAPISPIAAYGPGVFMRDDHEGKWLYHTGGYCPDDGESIGSLAAKLPNGISVAMIYTGCAETRDIETLNTFISRYLPK